MNFKKLAMLLALPGALALPGSAQALTTSGSLEVAVYDFNVNVFDKNWTAWFDAIVDETNAPLPDIVLGQDFADPAAVDDFNDMLLTKFGTSYSYEYSVAPSGNATNRRAIFWRDAKYSLAKRERWAGYGGTASTCPATPGQDNAQAIQVLLTDKSNSFTVGAVSMKTPPMGTNNVCAWRNMQLATAQLARPTWVATLHFVGIDQNAPDWNGSSNTCWYSGTVRATGGDCDGVNLDWSDPIRFMCAQTSNLRSCLNDNWTHRNQNDNSTSRIDYLFAKRGLLAEASSMWSMKTIDKGVCWTYSDHCSLRVVTKYI